MLLVFIFCIKKAMSMYKRNKAFLGVYFDKSNTFQVDSFRKRYRLLILFKFLFTEKKMEVTGIKKFTNI